eukprot:7825660-Ditylum_brightwellii.AAC.1
MLSTEISSHLAKPSPERLHVGIIGASTTDEVTTWAITALHSSSAVEIAKFTNPTESVYAPP